ncbi:MAG: hypothetical protein GY881_02880 [Gammaproteobacteria bacterium]|nr:hypothetical protein [Gammaproteobacteria bacterium]
MFNAMAMPGAGKTTLLVQMVERKLKAGGRALIIDPDGAEPAWEKYKRIDNIDNLKSDWKGAVVVDYDEKQGKVADTFDRLWSMVKAGKFKNFTLVLDDPNVYAIDKVIPGLKNLLRRKRQHNYDILTTAHNWGETPLGFLRFIDVWIIGPTSAGPEERSSNLGRDAVKIHKQWKDRADQEATAAKKAGRNHKFLAYTKDGSVL